MRNLLLASVALAAALGIVASSHAQTGPATVVNSDTCPVTTVLNTGNGRPLIETRQGALCTGASAAGSGNAVFGPTVNGSPAANPPVVIGGTGDGTGTGTVYNAKVDSAGNQYFSGAITCAACALETGGNLAAIKTDADALVAGLANSIPAGANDIGSIDQHGAPWSFTLAGKTTGGATPYGLQSAASTNSTSVKASAGSLLGMTLINTTTTIYYLRMYDSATAPTCSSATNFSRTWPIPPAGAAGGAGGVAPHLPTQGVAYANGIAFCLTGGPTSTDNTNAATGVFVNLDYN